MATTAQRVPLTARNAPPRLAVGSMYAPPPRRGALTARPTSGYNTAATARKHDPLAVHGYATLSPIAQGAFSQVTRARHNASHREVAIKTFNKAKYAKEPALAQAMKNELGVLQLLQPHGHAAIANILEIVDTKNSILAVLEYCGGGSLLRCLQSLPGHGGGHATGLGEDMSKRVARQVAQAMEHMHGLGVAHRDIKPENILFLDATQMQAKLCDFGFSIHCGTKRVRTVCGSPQYMAPELAKREPYAAWAVDMWAFGALVYEMLENKPAFRGSSMEQMQIRILRGSHEAFGQAVPQAARALIRSLLQVDVTVRMPARDALAHPWLR